jgi:hypothetical protein
MGLTHFPHGISSWGSPVMGGSMALPVMGGRIAATGDAKVYFVDPANGSDGNTGLSPDQAMDSVSAAYAKTVDKAGDTIYLLNDGNSSGTSREDATITWSNDNTHLVGLCAPTMVNMRARISTPTTQATVVSPQLTVSGNGNIFMNFSLFEGTAEAVDSTCVSVTGHRNYFNNVSMLNMGHTNTATRAGSEALLISAGRENTFDGCYIGLDTIARTGLNANVRFESGATRNIFRGCIFPMYITATTPMFIDANAANAIDRFAWFKDCLFHNATTSTQTAAQVARIHANVNGTFIMQDTYAVNVTNWETSASANLYTHGPAANATGGEMIVHS